MPKKGTKKNRGSVLSSIQSEQSRLFGEQKKKPSTRKDESCSAASRCSLGEVAALAQGLAAGRHDASPATDGANNNEDDDDDGIAFQPLPVLPPLDDVISHLLSPWQSVVAVCFPDAFTIHCLDSRTLQPVLDFRTDGRVTHMSTVRNERHATASATSSASAFLAHSKAQASPPRPLSVCQARYRVREDENHSGHDEKWAEVVVMLLQLGDGQIALRAVSAYNWTIELWTVSVHEIQDEALQCSKDESFLPFGQVAENTGRRTGVCFSHHRLAAVCDGFVGVTCTAVKSAWIFRVHDGVRLKTPVTATKGISIHYPHNTHPAGQSLCACPHRNYNLKLGTTDNTSSGSETRDPPSMLLSSGADEEEHWLAFNANHDDVSPLRCPTPPLFASKYVMALSSTDDTFGRRSKLNRARYGAVLGSTALGALTLFVEQLDHNRLQPSRFEGGPDAEEDSTEDETNERRKKSSPRPTTGKTVSVMNKVLTTPSHGLDVLCYFQEDPSRFARHPTKISEEKHQDEKGLLEVLSTKVHSSVTLIDPEHAMGLWTTERALASDSDIPGTRPPWHLTTMLLVPELGHSELHVREVHDSVSLPLPTTADEDWSKRMESTIRPCVLDQELSRTIKLPPSAQSIALIRLPVSLR